MVIFIYGENDYLALEKLKQLKEKFIEKYDDFNINELDIEEEELRLEDLSGEIETAPFIAGKRLLIVKNLLANLNKDTQKQVAKIIQRTPDSTILIIFEKKLPDKRSSLFKKLSKTTKVIICEKLKGDDLISWIENETKKFGGRIERRASSRLAFILGGNLWRLSNEINKLVNYCFPKEIKVEDIDVLVAEDIEARAFDLVDSLSSRNLQDSIRILHNLLKRGENELYLLSMIVYGFRNLVLVKYALDSDKKKIGLKIHPYVLSKTKRQVGRYNFPFLKKIYQRLLVVDEKIKRGLLEPTLALDLLIAELCLGEI